MSNLYHGIGKKPKGKRYATAKQSLKAKQVRHWGEYGINPELFNKYHPRISTHLHELNEEVKRRKGKTKVEIVDIVRSTPKKTVTVPHASYPHLQNRMNVADEYLKLLDIADETAMQEYELEDNHDLIGEEREYELEDLELLSDEEEIYELSDIEIGPEDVILEEDIFMEEGPIERVGDILDEFQGEILHSGDLPPLPPDLLPLLDEDSDIVEEDYPAPEELSTILDIPTDDRFYYLKAWSEYYDLVLDHVNKKEFNKTKRLLKVAFPDIDNKDIYLAALATADFPFMFVRK